jgi:uncharacterized coiled-coil protein SlyX
MKTITGLIIVFIILAGNLFAQERYPIFFEAGSKIELRPAKNIYIIAESQLDSCLKINELYKNCEKRIDLLKLKITQQDSIIKLLHNKEANLDSTLNHTSQKLDNCTDEAETCEKKLVKQTWYKKTLLGVAGLEALVLILLLTR